ncbi:MAG: SMI1/KNR4 family protein [Azonexus sp.]|nr:SMI1/KNR4 family protein [Azonexus sp.]
MVINSSQFWGTDSDHNPPITDEILTEAEGILGVNFPEELVALWRVQNGGYTQGFVYPTHRKTTWAEDHVSFHELFGIGSTASPSGIHNILNSEYMIKEWGLPSNQVLLAGDGHWWISLDYRNSRIPCVTWLDVAAGQDIELSPSFGEFLSKLLPDSAVDEETCRLAQ